MSLAASSLPAAFAQTFVDITASSGITHSHYATPPTLLEFSEPKLMTGGAAARDFDGDGFVDVIVTRQDSPPILYRNLGNGSFEALDHTVTGINIPAGSNGVAWGDINNNGHPDLYITTVDAWPHSNKNYLFINNGDGTFTEQAIPRGVDVSGKGPGYGVAFGDYDRDGYLDLATLAWNDPGGIGDRLFRNQGQSNPGYFTDVTVSAGVDRTYVPNFFEVENITYGFSPRFTDLDGDGITDLLIAGDFHTSRLFWGNGDGTFTDGTLAAGVGFERNGMGQAVGDFNRDGKLDYFVSSIWDENVPLNVGWEGDGSFLYTNQGDRTFTAEAMHTHWGWGSSFLDYNNNGFLDLLVVNGFVAPHAITTAAEKFENQPAQLFRNEAGALVEEVAFAEGIVDLGSGKGVVVLDIDNDGRLDVIIINNEGAPSVFHNQSSLLHDWIGFDTIGTESNRDGIGTLITVTVDGISQIYEIDGGSNFLSQNDKRAHFGLGAGNGMVDEIHVVWPSGITQTFYDIPANAYYVINETDGINFQPIPEPSTLALLACAALAWGSRRLITRRKRS